MRRSTVVRAVLAFQVSLPATAIGQTLSPTVRKIADIGPEWISGIIETRNGRFIIYAEGDSIRIRDRQSGVTTSVFGAVTDAVVNALGSSAAGNRIVFASRDDQNRGPFVWTLGIDTLTGKPIGAARRVGVIPATDPTLSPDGSRIAFAERNPSAGGIAGGAIKLFVIPSNGGDATLVTDVTGRGVIRVPRWSADGSFIYFQMYHPPAGGASLWRVRATGGKPDSLTSINLFTDVSPDGRHLALFPQGTNWQRTTRPMLAVTDPAGRAAGSFSLPAGTRPYSWSLTGAPRILAVQSNQPRTIKVLSLADGNTSSIPDTNSQLRKAYYSPDGGRYAYQALISGRFQFVVRDARTNSARVLATSAEPEGRWAWSPNGEWIAFISSSSGRWLTAVNVANGAQRRLVNLEPNENWRWRSDSRAIQYVSPVRNAGGGPAEVRAVTLDGRSSRLVMAPTMMVAGDWIALVDDTTFVARHAENGVRRLYVVSTTTGAQRVIYTGLASRAPSPIVVSPDKKWVAFSVAVPNAGGEQVAIAALDGSDSRVVGPPMQCGAGPAAWHPDGKHLLAWTYPSCATADYGESLYLFSLNGDAPRELAKKSGGNGEWSYSLAPDGRTVLYEVESGPGTRSIVEFDFGKSLEGRNSPTSSPARVP